MDLRKLKTILELFEESNIHEMEITSGEETVRLSRGGQVHNVTTISPAAPAESTPTLTKLASPLPVEAKKGYGGGHAVKSPVVGTFYRASSPDQPPFVQVGDKVKIGQTLCIIEAMKLMNEILLLYHLLK